MTPAAADRGLLAALAIAYDEAGMRDRPARLAHAAAHVGRPLSSSAELTVDEARALRRHLRGRARCNLDGRPVSDHDRAVLDAFAAELEERAASRRRPDRAKPPATCGCSVGGASGQPSPCDPAGRGRYCPPRICWCGSCPWWIPAPPVNYASAIAKLAEQTAGTR